MSQPLPKKLKAQCVSCRKSFGGTLEKLQATVKCPSCGATENWWRPIETRMIQRARVQAERTGAAPYVPPPAPGGYNWIPRKIPKNRDLVLGLGVAGFVMSPIGLITGPLGLLKAKEGLAQVKSGEVPPDGMLTAGMWLCAGSILFSLFGLWYSYITVDMFLQMDKIDRAETQLNQVGQAVENFTNRHGRFPASLSEVKESGATFTNQDPWGNEFGYDFESDGRGDKRAVITCFGADGERGGLMANEDTVMYVEWTTPFGGSYPGFGDYR